jgi:hypothetical protein
MYIAQGTVYLRLRVKSNILDGSDYGAYDHLKLTGFIAKDGWTTIGQSFTSLAVNGNLLYAVNGIANTPRPIQ